MKPGPELADRLRAEANRLEVSAPPVVAVARRGRRRTRLRAGAIVLSLVAFSATSVGLGLIVTSRDEVPRQQAGVPPGFHGEQETEERDQALERDEDVFEDSGATGAGGGDSEEYATSSKGLTGSKSGAHGKAQAETVPGSPAAGGSLASPRVIKTARLRLEVEENSLSGTFAEVERLAGRHGGFVSDSFTRSDPARSGELTIRVPAAVFESVVADLKSLGRVESQRLSGVDVTADFVDLQARLRNWEAQERVLVRLMGEANTISESLQVQRELQSVRIEIERIQGQIRVLRDQTELASISISIHEPGAEEEPRSEQGAWDRAVAAAGEVLAAMLIGLGYLLPILTALLVLWLGARAIRARRTD